MKINVNKESEVLSVGDIESNKVSIDTANLDFIITILSSNLYSNPIESFLRETISNAWDSHVEAGISDPVIVHFYQDSEKQVYCEIQDYGVGLSPERFNKIYKNIGSSTKRDDNSMIGGFGIGRFSALAYSDMVYITSYYDGIEYQYLMYKDGNNISIDLINQQPVDRRNGVTVRVPVKTGDLSVFFNIIKTRLSFFDNLYITTNNLSNFGYYNEDYQAEADTFNSVKIKNYKTFAVNTFMSNSAQILLGKVLYPINYSNIVKNSVLYNKPIAIKFDIGELPVTPNREQILYTDSSIAIIQNKLAEAEKELTEFISSKTNKDFNVLSEYVNSLNNHMEIKLLEDDDKPVIIKVSNNGNSSTFRGVTYDKKTFLTNYSAVMSTKLFIKSFYLDNSKLYKVDSTMFNRMCSIGDIKYLFNDNKVYFSRLGELNNYTKQYIRETFPNGSTFLFTPHIVNRKYLLNAIRDIQKHIKTSSVLPNKVFSYEIFKIIAREVIPNLKKLKVITDSYVPKSFIDSKKAQAKAARALSNTSNVNWKENMNIYPVRLKDYNNREVTIDTELKSLESLNKERFKGYVVYSDKGDKSFRALANLMLLHPRLKFIEVAPTKKKFLHHLSNYIEFKDFMSTKYRHIRNIGTALLIKDMIPYLEQLYKIQNLEKISVKLKGTVHYLYKFVSDHTSRYYTNDDDQKALMQDIKDLCVKERFYNFEVIGTLRENLKLLKNSKVLVPFITSKYYTTIIPEEQIPILLDYIKKAKLFIPDPKQPDL